MRTRADKEKTEARVNAILRILLDGAQKWDLTEFVREQEADPISCWHVGEGDTPLSYSQIRKLVGKAKRLIVGTGQGEREQLLQRAIAQRDNLYAKSVAMGDMRAALAILDSRDKLHRLFPNEERKPGDDGGKRIVLTVIEQLVINNQEKPPLEVGESADLPNLRYVQEHHDGTNGTPNGQALSAAERLP